jgi:DNA-binding response OmpR family regulator
MTRVLIVEDDAAMLRGLRDNFARKGYDVDTAPDGEKGLELALNERPDLIVLDIMLPKMNGYEICKTLRDEGFDMPIIMLTAKDQESDIVLGLNIGADDYVSKPFSIREFMARAQAHLRRSQRKTEQGALAHFGPFALDRTSKKLMRDNLEVPLTPKEYRLLDLFLERAGRALTRAEILRVVWGYNVFVTDRSVDRCVTTLRARIEEDPRRPLYIQTVRETGYRFEPGED